MLKKVITAVILFGFLSVAIVSAMEKEKPVKDNLPGLKIGSKAPDFELRDLNGQPVKLSDYKGKKVMLNFWATWCPPCKAEMPDMQKFHEEAKEDVVILAVNIDPQYDVRKFATDMKVGFPILLDKDDKVNTKYQILTIPTTYFIDSEGFIQRKYLSVMTIDKMRELNNF